MAAEWLPNGWRRNALSIRKINIRSQFPKLSFSAHSSEPSRPYDHYYTHFDRRANL